MACRQTRGNRLPRHATQLGQIIDDDPAGFTRSNPFIDAFADTPEIYWRTAV